MLTATQKQRAQSIINLFETGEVLADYGNVISGDTGHLTFGRSQTTLGSGNLLDLLKRYFNNPGARFGNRLAPWFPRFEASDLSLDTDTRLHNTLRATANDKVMQDVLYWQSAEKAATVLGVSGVAVVYDSTVHGSWKAMPDRTNQQCGAMGEQMWITAYAATRRQWLATSPRADLRNTVYRMDAFQQLFDQGFWGLELPLVVRAAEISLATLNATPPGCFDGPQPGTRSFSLQTPLARGLDAYLVQLGLSGQGADIKADGIFWQTSVKRLAEYQSSKGLPATGVAAPSLIAQLIA